MATCMRLSWRSVACPANPRRAIAAGTTVIATAIATALVAACVSRTDDTVASAIAGDGETRSGALTRESVCRILNVAPERLTDFVEYDPAFAIKFTILRVRPSGSAGDGDIFGAQQYAPFLDVEVDISA